MDSVPRNPVTSPDAEAFEFIRFCYRRRRIGWPELYDEMCAVASRGLFRGWGWDDLAAVGIHLSLFELPALAALAARVIAEEQMAERPGRAAAREGAGQGTLERLAGIEAVVESRPEGEARAHLVLAGGAV